jgi:hypothetical protein
LTFCSSCVICRMKQQALSRFSTSFHSIRIILAQGDILTILFILSQFILYIRRELV